MRPPSSAAGLGLKAMAWGEASGPRPPDPYHAPRTHRGPLRSLWLRAGSLSVSARTQGRCVYRGDGLAIVRLGRRPQAAEQQQEEVSHFEISSGCSDCFRYGPRGPGFGSRFATSAIPHSSVSPNNRAQRPPRQQHFRTPTYVTSPNHRDHHRCTQYRSTGTHHALCWYNPKNPLATKPPKPPARIRARASYV